MTLLNHVCNEWYLCERRQYDAADRLTFVIEGVIVLVMTLKNRHRLSQKILLYRDH